ncbi:MAG: hypothetical protein AAF196_05995 [Planctomycetota bacterium]
MSDPKPEDSSDLPPSLRDEMLDIYVSPRSHHPLRRATTSELESIGTRAGAGALVDRGGRPVAGASEAGLVCEAEGVLFPVVNRIPKLLWEDGIPLAEG